MNWSLKTQIIVRILPLLVFTILVMTIIVIQSAVSANRNQYQQRIHEVVDLIRTSRFPKTDGILENMKSLSGAEFVTVSEQGQVVSRTQEAPVDFDFGKLNQRQSKIDLSDAIGEGENRYYHSCIPVVGSDSRAPQSKFIHIFVPAEDYRKTWWSSIKLPLILAGIVIPLAVILCFAMANQVAKPLTQLRAQVEKIAEAEFDEASLSRNEIESLKSAIENMTSRLADHEQNVRKNQRLETMVQIGNGVAHNLRNCATGCKMAVELLAHENQDLSQSENLAVAKRQLAMMNQYISHFLNMGASAGGAAKSPNVAEVTDLVEVLQEAVFLLKPSAEHLGIELVTQCDLTSLPVTMFREDAVQMMTNLLKNAIEATSQQKAVSGVEGRVEAELTFVAGEVKFEVTDTGPGPAVELQSKLFEPFVTGKQEGTGLGLPLVRQIAEGMGGRVNWDREQGLTRFTVQFSIET